MTVLPGDEADTDKRLELRVKTPGDGTRAIHLQLGGSVEIAVNIDDAGIELKAQDTTFKLTQSSSSDGKAELKVGDSSVTIEQGGDVKIEAAGIIDIESEQDRTFRRSVGESGRPNHRFELTGLLKSGVLRNGTARSQAK